MENNENNNNDILAVGSIAIDSLETPNGNQENVLGGSGLYFGISASLFSGVSLVGVVGNDYPDEGWNILKKQNINIDNVQIKKGKTFRWGGKYSQDYSTRETKYTELGVFDKFLPNIKTSDINKPYVFLGNIHPALQLSVAQQMQSTKFIITDTMNLWIDISKKELDKVLQLTNILLINHEESEQYTGEKDISIAAKTLHQCGPKIIIIKMGEKGAYLSNSENSFFIPAYKVNKVIDPTGAGDSFAGGFVGSLAQTNNINFFDAVITGSAVASFSVEGFGAKSLLNCSKNMINKRILSIKNTLKNKV